MPRSASALGLATIDTASGGVLDVFYPAPVLGSEPATVELATPPDDELRGVQFEMVKTVLPDLDVAPSRVPDAYLRLHLLSHRLVRPHEVNLDGIFGVLPNVAWTSRGPVPLERIGDVQLAARSRGEWLTVFGVDKFPRMVDYVVPAGVRIADADRVRLGANAGLGISLGDDCIVEAGLYVTAGTRVTMPDGSVVKARDLSGESGLLFRRDSQTGAVVAVARSGSWGGLNAALHAND
jgi:2,3,4,5-tetrahydropyridine-2-carboxylate N-succinyltransferase